MTNRDGTRGGETAADREPEPPTIRPYPAIDDNDRREIRGALAEMARQLEKLTSVAFGRPATDATRRQRDLDYPVRLPAVPPDHDGPMLAAHGRVVTGNLAVVDHVKAFIRAVRDGQASVSAASLARGAVEPAAKSWYLLASADAAELFRRYVAVTDMELKRSIRFSELVDGTGRPVDGERHLADLRGALKTCELEPLQNVNLTKIVSDMLDAAAGGPDGRRAYSALSSVAHGEATATAVFLAARVGEVRLHLPAVMAYEYTKLLFMSCRIVARTMIEYAGLEREYRERWDAVYRRAATSMTALRDHLPDHR